TYVGGIGFGLNGYVGAGIYATDPNPDGSPYYRNLRFWTTRWDNGLGNYRSGDRMVIDQDGNVGIGSSTPVQKLDLGGGGYLNFADTYGLIWGNNGSYKILGSPTGATLDFISGGAEVMTIKGSRGGAVGIGTTVPGYPLTVTGDVMSSARVMAYGGNAQ